MYRNLIATGASAALTAAAVLAAQSAGATTWTAPKAAVTFPAHPAPGKVTVTVRTSACVHGLKLGLSSLTHPGMTAVSTADPASGKAFKVTVTLSAGRWTASQVTGTVCGHTGAVQLGPGAAHDAYSLPVAVAKPAPPATPPGSGKQEG